MSTTEPLTDFELTGFDIMVPIDSTHFETVSEAKTAIVETAARSIVAHDDRLDTDDLPYVTTQVSFDTDAVADVVTDEEIGIAKVQTRTELGLFSE